MTWRPKDNLFNYYRKHLENTLSVIEIEFVAVQYNYIIFPNYNISHLAGQEEE